MKLTLYISLVLAVLCLSPPLYGKKAAVWEEIMKPKELVIDNGQIFVTDEKVIHIYNLKDFKWMKTFGKEGEGPGEFKFSQKLTPYPEYLLINTVGKLMYFSRQGEFLRERRTDIAIINLFPVADKFFGSRLHMDRETGKGSRDFVLIDDSFSPLKVLASQERAIQRNVQRKRTVKLLSFVIFAYVYQDKIFIGDTSRGFHIDVFNAEGKKLYEISRKYQKQRVTDKYKSWRLQKIRENPGTQRLMSMRTFEFPEYFPAFRYFKVMSGRIFVSLYGKESDNGDFMLLDLKGNLLKTGSIKPDVLFTIQKNRVYYLIENEETEEWELHVEDI